MITCKNLMAASALALLTITQPATTVRAEDRYVYCDELARMVESLARAYQSGVPLSAALDVITHNFDGKVADRFRMIVFEVYSSRRWYTERIQVREASDWRNAAHVECLRAHGGVG